jgi:predicted transglutaminase-like cysteine proteinase
LRWAKAEAILGGTPSALQAILAQQQGTPLPQRAQLQPAAYVARPLTRAAIQPDIEISEAPSTGRPDVFGSVALKVRNSRLDWRWRQVERARIGGAAARFAEALTERDAVDRLEAVNVYVNRRVQFMDDERQYGRPDVWSAAADTLLRGRGDCEDYAIAKLQMLRRAGFTDSDLYLVIVKDLITRADHAVLVVRAAGRLMVLDNGTDKLLESEAIRDYRPVLTFAANGTWTHGYRMKSEATAIASAEDRTPAPLAPAAATQRSWSASLLAFNTGFNK